MFKWANVLLGLSFIDALLTHAGLNMGVIEESNPFILFLIEHHVGFMYAWKLTLGVLLVILSSHLSQKTLLRYMVFFAVFVYAGVMGVHGFWLYQLAG